jgi:hypothetical protein
MLWIGGWLNILIALAHLFIPILIKPIGPLKAPASVQSMGTALLCLVVVGISAFVGLLGIYGLSGSGRIRRLPFLRTVLLFTGGIFIGDLIDMAWAVVARQGWHGLLHASIVPFGILAVGLLYIVGTLGLWKELRPIGGPVGSH